MKPVSEKVSECVSEKESCRPAGRSLSLTHSLTYPLTWLILLFVTLAANGADVYFNLQDFTQGPVANRPVLLNLVSAPVTNSTGVITQDRRAYTNNATGEFTATNLYGLATYEVRMRGNTISPDTLFMILVPDTNITVNAKDILTTIISPNSTATWSIAQADGRFVMRTNSAATNLTVNRLVATNALISNVTVFLMRGTNFIVTNLVASDVTLLDTPTITNFTDAQHVHTNAATGGTLTAAAIGALAYVSNALGFATNLTTSGNTTNLGPILLGPAASGYGLISNSAGDVYLRTNLFLVAAPGAAIFIGGLPSVIGERVVNGDYTVELAPSASTPGTSYAQAAYITNNITVGSTATAQDLVATLTIRAQDSSSYLAIGPTSSGSVAIDVAFESGGQVAASVANTDTADTGSYASFIVGQDPSSAFYFQHWNDSWTDQLDNWHTNNFVLGLANNGVVNGMGFLLRANAPMKFGVGADVGAEPVRFVIGGFGADTNNVRTFAEWDYTTNIFSLGASWTNGTQRGTGFISARQTATTGTAAIKIEVRQGDGHKMPWPLSHGGVALTTTNSISFPVQPGAIVDITDSDSGDGVSTILNSIVTLD